jgi:NTP pyrophosphatase (non-canonical NTP hydrolase)
VDPADIVSTCTQCGAVCEANLANIMALLATQGLTIVGAKGRAVLEDEREMAALLQTRAFHQEIPERYRPKSTTQRLAYLVEECGEVLAAAGKSQRWGLESYNPDLPPDERETNAAWLLREMHDLKRAISLIENDGAVWAQAELARREKA